MRLSTACLGSLIRLLGSVNRIGIALIGWMFWVGRVSLTRSFHSTSPLPLRCRCEYLSDSASSLRRLMRKKNERSVLIHSLNPCVPLQLLPIRKNSLLRASCPLISIERGSALALSPRHLTLSILVRKAWMVIRAFIVRRLWSLCSIKLIERNWQEGFV